MPRFRPRHDRGPDDAHREQTADQGDLAPVAVHVTAIENHQRPEDAEEQRIAEHGTEHATRRPAGRRPAPHEVVVQRDELLVRFVRHDLVGAHDPVAAAHDVLVRIHAPPQLVPAPLGLEHVGHKGGPEEMVRQPDVRPSSPCRAARRGPGRGIPHTTGPGRVARTLRMRRAARRGRVRAPAGARPLRSRRGRVCARTGRVALAREGRGGRSGRGRPPRPASGPRPGPSRSAGSPTVRPGRRRFASR